MCVCVVGVQRPCVCGGCAEVVCVWLGWAEAVCVCGGCVQRLCVCVCLCVQVLFVTVAPPGSLEVVKALARSSEHFLM